jgi:hypothetical protein
MKRIHPLYIVCLSARVILVWLIWIFFSKYNLKPLAIAIVALIGAGFTYKAVFGSNHEIQISKVFWHDSRVLHAVLYSTALIYLLLENLNMAVITLLLDLVSSLMYRTILCK